ncbi:hypothetical protein, partial [Variovorax sp. Root473]|uniref:hypothetical protein n=1 Tax=Variovorax sp. Root473 TaxID=1736541 RepID=UPI0012FB45E0
MKINDLQIFRYSITGFKNGVHSTIGSPSAQMAATYQQLITFHEERVRRETRASDPTQILRNHLTALRAYITAIGKTEHPQLATRWRRDFTKPVRAEVEVSHRADQVMSQGWKP